MFDHVTIRVTDRAASERFYTTVLAALGVEQTGELRLAPADEGHPVTRRLHIGFGARSRAAVDAFWRAGVEAGYRDDGAPGVRAVYSSDYYGAFLLDPDGNSAEAVHGSWVRPPGIIDHLWLRVAEVAAAKRFYATIAPFAGLRMGADTPHRIQFRTPSSSFSMVSGDAPTEHAHLGFTAAEDATRGAFQALDPDGNTVEVIG